MLVYAGVLLRFFIHREDDDSAGAGLIVGALGLILGFIEVAFRPNSRIWRWTVVYSDLLLVSFAYVLTHRLESDFFLFYYLPVITTVQEFNTRKIRLIGGLAALGLAVDVTYLARAVPMPIDRVYATVLLPREFFLLVVVLIASHLVRARSALPDALAELVRATSGASTLDRELDGLLDDVMQLGFDRAAVALVDDYMNTIQVVRGRNVSPRQIFMSRFSLDHEDIMADVVRTGRTEIFRQGQTDRRFDAKIYKSFDHQKLARVFIPIGASGGNGNVIGTLECARTGAGADAFVEQMAPAAKDVADRRAMVIGENRTHILLSNIAQEAIDVIGAGSASLHVYRGSKLLYQAGAGRADPHFLKNHPPRVPGGVGWRAIVAGKSITVDPVSPDSAEKPVFEAGVRAYTAFPMLHLGDPDLKGVLYVHFWTPERRIAQFVDRWLPYVRRRRFTPRLVDVEALFVKQLEGVIQNHLSLRRTSEAAEQTWQVALLQNFIQSLATGFEPASLLEMIAEGALLHLPQSDCVTLYQYFGRRQAFDFPPVMKGHFEAPDLMRDEVFTDHTSWLLSSIKEPRFLFSVTTNEELTRPYTRWSAARFVHREGIQSSAQLPLKDQSGELVGLLFINYRSPHHFDEAEKKAMKSFASAAAIAIANTRLLANERQQRQEIRRLQETLGELREPFRAESVARELLQQLEKIQEYAFASLHLVQGEELLTLAAGAVRDQHAPQPYPRTLRVDPFIVGVLQGRSPIAVRNTAPACWPNATAPTWIGLPLYRRGKAFALIAIDSPNLRTLRPSDLQAFAEQAAVALHRALQFEEAHQRIEHLEILREVYDAIEGHSETDPLVSAIAAQVAKRMRSDQCTIFIKTATDTGAALVPRGLEGMFSESARKRTFVLENGASRQPAGPVLEAFCDGRSLAIDGTEVGNRATTLRFPERRASGRSMIAVPISAGDHRIGVMSVEKNTPAFFQASDRLVLETIAKSAGIAIDRARGMRLSREVGQEILKAIEVDDVLNAIVTGVVHQTDVDAAVIFLEVGNAGAPAFKTFVYPPLAVHEPRKGGLTERILQSGEILQIENIAAATDASDWSRAYRSLIGVPLITRVRAEGVLFLFSHTDRRFTDSERSLLQSLATQGALVIQKVQRLKHVGAQLVVSETQNAKLSKLLAINEISGSLFHYIQSPVSHFPVCSDYVRTSLSEIRSALEQVESTLSPLADGGPLGATIRGAVRRCEEAAENAKHIQAGADRISAMTQRISSSMDRYANSDGRTSRVHVNRLVSQACNDVRLRLGHLRPAPAMILLPDHVPGEVDVQELMVIEALANVIANAVEAVQGRDDGSVGIMTTRVDGVVEIAVQDNGVGIAEEDLPKLFNLRYTKGKPAGFGYGLWFSKLVFDAYGIDVSISSVLGAGTTFRLRVPDSNGGDHDRNNAVA